MSNKMREIAYFLGNYPATHYVLIAVTVVVYVFAEVRATSFKDKVAAGCASVLFCVSISEFENGWQGAAPLNMAQRLFAPLALYFLNPITNGVVVYVLLKNLFGKTPIRAWAYTLLCLVHAPLSAFALYLAHEL